MDIIIPNSEMYVDGDLTVKRGLETYLKKHGLDEADLLGLFGGRFMPFHHGHLGTLRRVVAAFPEHVHVGIVNPDPWDTQLVGERFTLDKNFLTYAERAEMLEAAQDVVGRPRRVTTGPYYPSRWYGREKHWRFIPGSPNAVVRNIAVRDDFDREKLAHYLKERNGILQVVPLVHDWDGVPYSAGLVRRKMLKGENWRQLVPEFTAEVIDRYHIVERLRDLTADEERKKELERRM